MVCEWDEKELYNDLTLNCKVYVAKCMHEHWDRVPKNTMACPGK